MLIDRGPTILLVLRDQPFVSPWENEVGEFARVGPPAIAIIAEPEKATLLELAQAKVGLRDILLIEAGEALGSEGTHLMILSFLDGLRPKAPASGSLPFGTGM